MGTRKLIGVIISEVEGVYQNKLLKGIISECYSLNYDVAVFSTFIMDKGLPEYKIGEKAIFGLMNFERFDGIIVAGFTLTIENLAKEIEQRLRKECTCPVLYVDHYSMHFPSVYTNDRNSFKQIVDHLIESHGYKDIFCLAGNPESIITMNRVAGYKDSLLEHNLEVDESKISYEGDFYYTGGEQLARKILKGEIAKPEAVVCINDYMAIGLSKEFMEQGVHIPEDIAVTGYDATEEAATGATLITTFAPPIMYTGVEAVCELTRLMTGTYPKPCNINESHIEIGHSCGCNDIDYVKRSGVMYMKERVDDYKRLLDSYMSEALTAAASFEDCIDQFSYYLYLIKDFSDYYLCLCDNWDGSANNYSLEKENDLRTDYTSKMMLVLAKENKELINEDITFDTKDMLPDLWRERETPKVYYFTPLHFNEHCMGYSVLTYTEKAEAFDIIYRNWSRNIMNALEFNRTHKKLYCSSFRDVLTGIYNRNGLDQNLIHTLNAAKSRQKKMFVLMADLDNLKTVNDWFGHKEGDNVISVVANAFLSCCKPHDLCARLGGDEFLAVGVDGDNEASVDNFINSVQQYIEHYNETSKKPYNIEISMGAVSDYIREVNKIKEMVDQADRIMYYNKAFNKKDRKSWTGKKP